MAIIFFLLDILSGPVYIPLHEIFGVFFNNVSADASSYIIIVQSRLPKAITAVVAGTALPVAGLMMQTYFRNPVAGPDILGVSAGAGLFVAIVTLTAGTIFAVNIYNSVSIIIAAILGSVVILLIILSVASKVRDSITLLIFGLMFGMAISAVVGVLQYFSEKGALKLFILWTFGSLSGVTWDQLYILIPIIVICIVAVFLYSKQLNLLLLGESYSKSLGLDHQRSKYIIILLTGILTGSITAFCGPIAFIGIAVPHIARMLWKTNDHFILIPASVLCGITILLICDVISQTPGDAGILPLNSITAFMGAPFIIYILWRNQHMKTFF
ncbi:MAG: iron chelate uptake ABC transporter family permease subunit [Chitinophagales bacterium]